MYRMKRMYPFIFILLFAALFITSYYPRIYTSRYGPAWNITTQVGLGAAILLFFITRRKKRHL